MVPRCLLVGLCQSVHRFAGNRPGRPGSRHRASSRPHTTGLSTRVRCPVTMLSLRRSPAPRGCNAPPVRPGSGTVDVDAGPHVPPGRPRRRTGSASACRSRVREAGALPRAGLSRRWQSLALGARCARHAGVSAQRGRSLSRPGPVWQRHGRIAPVLVALLDGHQPRGCR